VKIAIVAMAVASAGLAVGIAPVAGAEPTPPTAEGMYTQTEYDGDVTPIQVRWDCGPGCYVMDNPDHPGPGTQYHFDPASNRWFSSWSEFEATCANEVIGQMRYFVNPNDGLRIFDEHDITKAACGQQTPEAFEAAINNQDQNDTIPFATLVPVA
jgi:hypothetical protein